MAIYSNGQVGWFSGIVIPSTLSNSIYSVYKAESNANDALGTYNGTAQGGLTYGAGKSGQAFVGNGTNAYVQLPNNSHNFTGDFSVNMWFNLATTAGNQDLFSNADYNSSAPGIKDFGYRVQYRGLTNNIRVSIYGSSAVTLDTPNFVSTNTWYMITVTRKVSNGTKIYVNGTLSTSNNSTINPNYTGTFAPCIGVYKATTTPQTFNYLSNGSKIDEVNTWNRELTASEITEAYNSGTGKFYPY